MKEVVVFAYNFPHRKTQDFLFHLFGCGIKVDHVFAADAVKLDIPPSEVRTKIRHCTPLHPSDVTESIGAQYHQVPHQGSQINSLIEEINPEIGIIAGARILQADVINGFSNGIINFHPGLIPEVRGLDALLWSIRNDISLGVTSHLIDERVDAGKILDRRTIDLHEDDTIFDLSERLYEIQLEMLPDAIDRAQNSMTEEVDFKSGAYNRKMNGDMERETVAMLPKYLERKLL
ncbi:formyltransferase family protein [Verrucomicrobiales bacterium]|nr:formyltransferase family protein [Verrucomicrobiales bacterium]